MSNDIVKRKVALLVVDCIKAIVEKYNLPSDEVFSMVSQLVLDKLTEDSLTDTD